MAFWKSRPPKPHPLRSCNGIRWAIKLLGSVSARLLAVACVLLRRFDYFLDKFDYTMDDINDGHGGVVASATLPVVMYVFSSLTFHCYLLYVQI
jgi:hypothetical protein